MRIAEVSCFPRYSVGKIMKDIKKYIDENTNDICHIFYARDAKINNKDFHYFGNYFIVKANALLARIFDNDGFCIKSITKKLINQLKEFNPDVVHIHCLHGYYMNVKTLFDYLKSNPQIHVVWTMHDTWAFTGHCCFFSMANCNKWKNQCGKCIQKSEYPASYIFDHSHKNHINKKKIFTSLDSKQMKLVVPSDWLNDLVKISFLKKYDVKTIHNTIDTTVFNASPSKENITLPDKKILLGVASVWDKRKGLDTFLEIAKVISSDWHIVLIGRIDKKIKLPLNVMHIDRTTNQEVLKTYYQKANVLLNPTLDDNYPTVNLEAQACGCKVITFDTGGCKETNCGNLYVQRSKNINDIKNTIIDLQNKTINKVDIYGISKNRMAKEYYTLFTKE